jgi:anti-sigma B factor antagonist
MGTSDRRDVDNLRISATDAPDGGVVLGLAGELDLSTVTMFVEALDGLLDDDPVRIELDLSALSFIDSSGVGAYVTAFRKAQATGSQLSIGDRSALVQRVLELSGVEAALAQESAENR